MQALANELPSFDLSLQLLYVPAELLAMAGGCFNGLTRLLLTPLPGQKLILDLPGPEALPSLRQVGIGWASAESQRELWPSLARFLPQLVSLQAAWRSAQKHTHVRKHTHIHTRTQRRQMVWHTNKFTVPRFSCSVPQYAGYS